MKKIFFLIQIFVNYAFADVVFVDLNHVDAEIAVVRAELAKRKPPEKLILLPLDHQAYAGQAMAADAIEEKIKNKAHLYSQQCQDSSTPACQQMQTEYLKLKEQKSHSEQMYNTEALKKDLSTLNNENISSVMVSGHHVKQTSDHPSQFYGDFGNIPVDGFMSAFKDFPGRNQVSSVYLLGCRSAIPQDLGSVWKAAFPNANYIVGYENTGFLKDNPNGHAFIQKAMGAEKSILLSTTIQEAINKFKAISPKNSTYGTAACITLSKNASPIFLSSSKGSSNLSSQLGCSDTSEKVKVAIDYMKCVQAPQPSANCPLKDVTKVSALARKECDFQIPDQLNEAIQFRSQQKVLENLMNPGAKVNFSSIFAMAPSALKKDLNLNEPPTSLSEAKSKLEAIKKNIDAAFDFNKIADTDISVINQMAQKKIFFDKAYLAVSNLDIAQYESLLSSVEYPSTDHGGILRAQAFQQKASANRSLNYQDRIHAVELQMGQAPSGDARGALRQELDELNKFSQGI